MARRNESPDEDEVVEIVMAGDADAWPTTWEQLNTLVSNNDNVYVFTMDVLRDLENAGRLGSIVRSTISRRLAGLGLGHLPAELPAYQGQQVIVYRLGTPAAAIVDAISNGANQPAAAALRRANVSRDAEKIEQIRAILDG